MKNKIQNLILAGFFTFLAQFTMAQCGNTGFQSTTICQSHPIIIHGQVVDSTGVYNDTINLSVGCDSFTVWQVQVIPNIYTNVYDTICQGDTVSFWGRKFFATGNYYDTLFVGTQNCDSILALYLFVSNRPHPSDTVYHTFCRTFGPGGGSYYNFYGQHLRNSGTYNASVPATHGCDTLRTLVLTVIFAGFNPPINATICNGSYYLFHGRHLTMAGTYADTVTSVVTGCDSITTLNLTIGTYAALTVRDSFCAGSSYNFHGTIYTTRSPGGFGGGGYIDTVAAVGGGCDTIFTLILRYKVAPSYTVIDSFCQGTYYHYGPDSFNTAGNNNYAYIHNPGGGCDTAVRLRLTYRVGPPAPTITQSGATLIANVTGTGPYTYTWMLGGMVVGTSQLYTPTTNGTYIVVVSSGVGCNTPSAGFNVVNLGINDIINDMFKLYPNPNTGKFTLEVQHYTGVEATVYDVLGRVVAQKQLTADKEPIDISNAPNGTYSIILRSNDGIRTAYFSIAR